MTDRYYKSSDQILTVEHGYNARNTGYGRTQVYIFDFEFKTMTVIANFNDYSQQKEETSVHTFPTVDEGLLEKMRNKLVEMGGKPDPLNGNETKLSLPAPKTQKGLIP